MGVPWRSVRRKTIAGFIGNLSGTAIEHGTTVPVWDDMKRFRHEVRRLARNHVFRGIRVGGRSVSGAALASVEAVRSAVARGCRHTGSEFIYS